MCRYVYQKAYVEFFVAPDKFAALEGKLQQLPSITYLGVNAAGDLKANVGMADINAVTWGVFPGKEVVQPTVVDPVSFMVWKVRAQTPCLLSSVMRATSIIFPPILHEPRLLSSIMRAILLANPPSPPLPPPHSPSLL